MAKTDGLEISTEAVNDGYIIRPVGDIDLSRSPDLRTELAELLKRGPRRLVVDLSQVSYMDSSGVATLVEAMQIGRKKGTRLILCGMQEKVRAIFEIARLDTVFTIVDDVEEAVTM